MDPRVETWEASLPQRVEIIEVGPRDGFQNLPEFIETADKVRIINALIDAGIRRIEVTSFVHPKLVPQMRDAAEVVRRVKRPGCQCFAMTPNMKGAERAIEAGVEMLNLIVSASESHNHNNVGMSVDQSLGGFGPMIALASQSRVGVRASIATVFGCPFEGNIHLDRVIYVCGRLLDLGCVELNLCDTTGMANPRQVVRVAKCVQHEFPGASITMHFHNTRGAGAANLLAALQNGITSFEASFGGLGGCPFAPGAAGNVCTEDIVHMLHEMGIDTGIDLLSFLTAVRSAEGILHLTFSGQVIKAGRACDLHEIPMTRSTESGICR